MSTAALNHEPADLPPSPARGPGDGEENTAGGGLAAQSAERRAKRDALEAQGINPYPTRFDRTSTLAELHSAHSGLAPDTRTGEQARVAGRVNYAALDGGTPAAARQEQEQ